MHLFPAALESIIPVEVMLMGAVGRRKRRSPTAEAGKERSMWREEGRCDGVSSFLARGFVEILRGAANGMLSQELGRKDVERRQLRTLQPSPCLAKGSPQSARSAPSE